MDDDTIQLTEDDVILVDEREVERLLAGHAFDAFVAGLLSLEDGVRALTRSAL